MAELVDPKDPNATNLFGWDVSAHCADSGTTLTSAAIEEVDDSDAAVASPTVTITGVSLTSDGHVTAFVGGGTVGTSVLLRCRYTLANGETDDATIKVRMAHR